MNIDIGGKTTIFADTSKYFIDAPDKISLISPSVNFGSDVGAEALALGETLLKTVNTLIDELNQHMHPSPAGPTGAPLTPMTKFTESILSTVSKTD
jgi:hypothetical protein